MAPAALEIVELTEREREAIAEAWLGHVHSLPADAEPDMEELLRTGMFAAIVNEILLAHDFVPYTAIFRWTAGSELLLMALPAVVAGEATGHRVTDVS